MTRRTPTARILKIVRRIADGDPFELVVEQEKVTPAHLTKILRGARGINLLNRHRLAEAARKYHAGEISAAQYDEACRQSFAIKTNASRARPPAAPPAPPEPPVDAATLEVAINEMANE